MQTLIRVIGTAIVCIGLAYLIWPQILRTSMRFFSKGSRLYLAGLVRFALAIVFVMGSRHCGIKWVILIFGLIFLLSGLLIFVLGIKRAKNIITWYLEQRDFIFRIIAGIVLAVGFIIVYAA